MISDFKVVSWVRKRPMNYLEDQHGREEVSTNQPK
jgi:hypothetical protein